MTLKVRIGSTYQRRSYEWRDRNGQYQALRPPLGRDAELLQEALLKGRQTLGQRVLRALGGR